MTDALSLTFFVSGTHYTPPFTIVFRKTKGSPFFIREFLCTLVDNDLVKYSLREKRWTWDVDSIAAQPITGNVLQLISKKMNSLSNDIQNALKVVSCFGMKLLSSIVKDLSGNSKFQTLQDCIDDAVQHGILEFDGVFYRFGHDKIRESAYALMSEDEKVRYHFDIGMSMYYSSCNKGQEEDEEMLFTTIEQINHGVPSMLSSLEQQTSIARLNYKAGLASMKR
jgi:predicted ATPase